MAMSGGVDSSVAAILLKEQGFEIIGITMKTWDYESSCVQTKDTSCCSIDSINDARSLAVKIGIPHYVFDVKEEFEKYVVSDFINEYLEGRTPNPCVVCNRFIKWDLLLKKADQLGCKYIATGHYAQLRKENERYVLSKGADISKDQSYMLWSLSQENFARTLFPLGGFSKEEIKKMASDSGFEKIAKKRESYEICFVPDNDYRNFLKNRISELKTKVQGGKYIDSEGNTLGEHKGYPFYTIGQRKGLEIALGEPMYVNNINPKNNTVRIGKKEELLSNSMTIRDFNLIKYEHIPNDGKFTTKIRYQDKGTESNVFHEENILKVEFSKAVSAIAPGQSAVIYEDNDVVAGGFIV